MVKPSGTSGFFQVRANEQGDISGAFVPTPYSTEKAEIERQMVVSFISSMNKNLATSCEEFFLSNPKQNQENNIDFTVDSPNGLAYLELMEIASLKGPYTTASSSYKPYEFAKAVLAGIKQKSDHYAGTQGRDIFLLLYVTHWSFIPSSSTLACLRYWLARQSHRFRAIFSFYLLDPSEGVPQWIFPYPPDLLCSFDPEVIRDDVCLNLDPRKFEVDVGK
jgi:hypothetical protein